MQRGVRERVLRSSNPRASIQDRYPLLRRNPSKKQHRRLADGAEGATFRKQRDWRGGGLIGPPSGSALGDSSSFGSRREERAGLGCPLV